MRSSASSQGKSIAANEAVADVELVQRVALGERDAVRQVVDTHLTSLTQFASRMLGDPKEAEDVTQETFLRLWRRAKGWKPQAKLSTWLHRVAYNLCVDKLRARRVRAGAEPLQTTEPPTVPVSVLERREAAQAVNEALAELPDRQRAAINLVYYQGLRNYEAAQIMGVHVDALESLLARARRKLRQRLQGSQNESEDHDAKG